MIRSYVTIAWRNLRRDAGYTALNGAGLALGLAASLVIALFIYHKLSYDRFHEAADRIYRVIQSDVPHIEGGLAQVPYGLPQRIVDDVPDVEQATALRAYRGRNLLARGDVAVDVDNIFRVDAHFFDVFSFRVLRGAAGEALSQPGQIILTASTARRLFGSADPLGQVVEVGGDVDYRVAAIAADPPANSHFRFDALLSFPDALQVRRAQSTVEWERLAFYLYVKTQGETSRRAFQEKLAALASTSEEERDLMAQPLTDIHLYSPASLRNTIAPQGDVLYLYLFGAVGALILVVASANYVNLTTAQALHRAREVGVRKTIGATRRQLIQQFLGDSMLIVAVATPAALALAYAALPLVNQAVGMNLSFQPDQHAGLLVGVVLGALALGVLAGSYPAFVLSSFAPSSVLAGSTPMVGRRGWVRDGLVAIQFAIAAGLLLGTLVVYHQLDYVQRQQLGTEEHIITIRSGELGGQLDAFKQEVRRAPHVVSAAVAVPPGIGGKYMERGVASASQSGMGSDEPPEPVAIAFIRADADYLETLGMQMVAGRNFAHRSGAADPDAQSSTGVLVNETLAERFDVQPNEVGSAVDVGGMPVPVRGIVADYHNAPLHEPIQPIIIMPYDAPPSKGKVLVRLDAERTQEGLDDVRAVWDEFVTNQPLDYQFLDDRIEAQYASSQRLMRVFGLFAVLALGVTGLGLLGLTAYAVSRRTPEIGIRKVLGASAASVTWLFAKDIAWLVGIGVILGLPLTYLGADRWLQRFAYQTEIGMGFIAGTAATVALVAVAVASAQALRAARIDPAETLRHE
jgi:putative ABC transport system permease protein